MQVARRGRANRVGGKLAQTIELDCIHASDAYLGIHQALEQASRRAVNQDRNASDARDDVQAGVAGGTNLPFHFDPGVLIAGGVDVRVRQQPARRRLGWAEHRDP